MSDGDEGMTDALAQLRQAFDGSFAAPPVLPQADQVRLLVVEVGGSRLAVRLEHIQALEALPRRVTLPGAPPELLGLVGLRGRLVPVFSLARLLEAESSGEPRWLLLVGGDDPLGLALDGFHGQFEVSAPQVRAAGGGRARPHVPELVRLGGSLCGVLDLPSLVGVIRGRAAGPLEES
jgi:purine-binding chemotaxis protein CheW